MPATSATSFIASMSISGIPPFNGFFSKLIIIIAAVMARFYLLAALAVIVSIITLASFLKFQRYAFFNKSDDKKNRADQRSSISYDIQHGCPKYYMSASQPACHS